MIKTPTSPYPLKGKGKYPQALKTPVNPVLTILKGSTT